MRRLAIIMSRAQSKERPVAPLVSSPPPGTALRLLVSLVLQVMTKVVPEETNDDKQTKI